MSKSTVSASHPAVRNVRYDLRHVTHTSSWLQWHCVNYDNHAKCFSRTKSVFNHRETLVGDDVTQSDTHTGQPDWPATQSSEMTPPDDPRTCPWLAAESTGIYTHYIQQHCGISTSNTHRHSQVTRQHRPPATDTVSVNSA